MVAGPCILQRAVRDPEYAWDASPGRTDPLEEVLEMSKFDATTRLIFYPTNSPSLLHPASIAREHSGASQKHDTRV